MGTKMIPFRMSEVRDPERLRALIVVSRPARPAPAPDIPTPIGVAAATWGMSQVVPVWIAGYATNEVLIRALLVAYILLYRTEGIPLEVHTSGLAPYLDMATEGAPEYPFKITAFGREALQLASLAQSKGLLSLRDPVSERSHPGFETAKQYADMACAIAQGFWLDFQSSPESQSDLHVQDLGLGVDPDED